MDIMAILANYADTEASYGLLGPQLAATIIQENTNYDCLVVAVGHDFDRQRLKQMLYALGGSDRPVIGFSNLGGRTDLWALAREFKEEGAITIIGGPQAGVDFEGEVDCDRYPHRFFGLKNSFTYALQGPAEQLIPLLNSRFQGEPEKVPGLVFIKDGCCQDNRPAAWNGEYLGKVNWNNLFRIGLSELEPLEVDTAQVVQQIGCPYAARSEMVELDYPTILADSPFTKIGKILVELKGCSFCDVARDKGFGGNLALDNVLAQIINLPEDKEGRKIPFELINEAPLPSLPQLLSAIQQRGIDISQVNLVTRADWLVAGEDKLRKALEVAKHLDVRLLLSSVGFESFVDSILSNLNKGYTVETVLSAVRLMRQFKKEFPDNWFYSTADGASHGFIHPTLWDSKDTEREMNAVIFAHSLFRDILPGQSTPLLVHHASGLGDWLRELEVREGITLNRQGSIIEWW